MNAALTSRAFEAPNDESSDLETVADVPPTIDALLRENTRLRGTLARLQGFRTLAYKDQLTGLWNRRYFEERMGEELSRARRDSRRRFSVMVVDVNDLKRINDTLGHAAGDRAIAWTGGFLKASLRDTDIICRTGGDEFTIIFPEIGGPDCALLVDRLRRLLAQAAAHGEQAVGLSIGSSSFPENGVTTRSLIEGADAAMYADKRAQKRATDPRMSAAG